MTPFMTTSPHVPVLQAGDRLTRVEFERRYSAMPGLKKAELIDGIVYMPSPVRYTPHGRPHAMLSGWLAVYSAATPGVRHAIDTTLRLDLDNEPQPDLLLRIDGRHGRSRLDAEQYLEGTPELIVEIAASSVSYDLHQKLHVYRRAGVLEYLVVRPQDAAVDWFVQQHGAFERLSPNTRGMLASTVFPGLELDVAALLRDDEAALHSTLRLALGSSAHRAFVDRLRG
jgi:Uma2 family endonuclease